MLEWFVRGFRQSLGEGFLFGVFGTVQIRIFTRALAIMMRNNDYCIKARHKWRLRRRSEYGELTIRRLER